jgi:DNA topoisomerase I
MGTTLIIAEKPSVALRVAIALGNNTQKRINLNGVGYYEMEGPNGKMYVAAAVGHIFTIAQTGEKHGYPVLDVHWAASYEVNKTAYYTKKYLDVFKELGARSDNYINACDFDIEGTVIGTNIIKFIGGGAEKKAKRMKFSTTTIPDIKNAFENLMPLDISNFNAGEARHMLDWLWGINLSRALSSAIATTKFKRPLSIGRVQGPTLAMLARRELEIQKFVSKPYWDVFILIKEVEFANAKGDIFEKLDAEKVLANTESNIKNALVEDVEETEQLVRPYPPFDLTSLQLEASRVLRLDPSITLSTAQTLYERGYTSYPRTSSQKLPPTLGLPKIIGELAKNPKYEHHAKILIEEKRFRPNEGIKSDEAHPAIYPTGVIPKDLTDVEGKLYDLIVRRFIACFAAYAKVARMKVIIKIAEEKYIANGVRIIERGWFEFYTFSTMKDKPLPELKKGQNVDVSKAYMHELQTQPPKRYGKAALIAELEKRMLGTKATRAAIIDALFKREYIEGSSIKVTDFGMSVFKALDENANMIVNEETTKRLDEDMEMISANKKSEDEVIKEGKDMLLEALKIFDQNKEKIGKEMEKGLVDSEVKLGTCLKDGGDLIMRRSKLGKQFVACANYPKCINTYSVPQNALIVPTGNTCEHCHTPIIKVIRKGKGVFEMDLDPDCVTKAKRKEKLAAKAAAAELQAKEKEAKMTKVVKIKQQPKITKPLTKTNIQPVEPKLKVKTPEKLEDKKVKKVAKKKAATKSKQPKKTKK